MDSVLSNEVARRIAADLATLVSEAEKHGTLPRIKSVAFYFNETELRTIIKLLRSCHGILDPAQSSQVTDAMVDAAAREMWNDRDARMGGPWEMQRPESICAIQTRATARAALIAALAAQPPAAPVERTIEQLTADLSSLGQAVVKACDLLAERAYGNSARSPGHNARLVLEQALAERLPSPPRSSAAIGEARTQAFAEAMDELDKLRTLAATDFKSPNCQGQRGVDRTDAFFDAYHAIRKLSEAIAPAEPQALPVKLTGEIACILEDCSPPDKQTPEAVAALIEGYQPIWDRIRSALSRPHGGGQ